MSGMFRFRAGVRAGRLYASLPRRGCSRRLTHLRCRIIRCLNLLTVHVWVAVRLIAIRDRAGSAVLIV